MNVTLFLFFAKCLNVTFVTKNQKILFMISTVKFSIYFLVIMLNKLIIYLQQSFKIKFNKCTSGICQDGTIVYELDYQQHP